ncbi:TetR/AcrR family transcriptional regulator [Paenibacillus daejeonensis]|uniref:TetR/AcrR family transcriptional regulator n=1 Tax=Paenibacillus daejeonensis TaxID=135193 RepID=UPI00036D7D59|nr:TetR/AcrR family transcriptional regulator [Paenibacillus daejeonensis]
MISELSLREIKKARTKLALYEAGLALMHDKMFHEVMLEDICRKAEVSKVTFFKFFPQKEDLLVYFMRIWLSERIIEIETNQLKGFGAVRHVLRSVAVQSKETPGILSSLISFLAQMKMHPRMPELSEAEVSLLFPGQEKQGARSPNMFELFRVTMQQASEQGQLRPDVTVEGAARFLFTIFYGAHLTAQQFQTEDLEGNYELHLRVLEHSQGS